jgi:hypothetical protein
MIPAPFEQNSAFAVGEVGRKKLLTVLEYVLIDRR